MSNPCAWSLFINKSWIRVSKTLDRSINTALPQPLLSRGLCHLYIKETKAYPLIKPFLQQNKYGDKKHFACKFIWFWINFSNTFEITGRTLARLYLSLFKGVFLKKIKSVTSAFLRLPGNSPVFSAWLRSCCNVSGVTIALVFLTLSVLCFNRL